MRVIISIPANKTAQDLEFENVEIQKTREAGDNMDIYDWALETNTPFLYNTVFYYAKPNTESPTYSDFISGENKTLLNALS